MNKKLFIMALLFFGAVGIFVFWSLSEKTVQLKAGKKDSVALGKEIFYGKGRCGICHTIGVSHGGKCPNLDGAGHRLTRDFIYESMISPSAYVKLNFDLDAPKFYPARMPAVNRPPIGLTEAEMQGVMAFVVSQGG